MGNKVNHSLALKGLELTIWLHTDFQRDLEEIISLMTKDSDDESNLMKFKD